MFFLKNKSRRSLQEEISSLMWQLGCLQEENKSLKERLFRREVINLCNQCLPEPLLNEDSLLQDTGDCSACGAICTEVADMELIKFYKTLGLSNKLISAKLPRLRHRTSQRIDPDSRKIRLSSIAEKLIELGIVCKPTDNR